MVRSSEVICITCNTNLVTGKVIPADATVEVTRITPQQKRIGYLVAIGLLLLIVAAVVWLMI